MGHYQVTTWSVARRPPTREEMRRGHELIIRWLLDDAAWLEAKGHRDRAFRFYRLATERLEEGPR